MVIKWCEKKSKWTTAVENTKFVKWDFLEFYNFWVIPVYILLFQDGLGVFEVVNGDVYTGKFR